MKKLFTLLRNYKKAVVYVKKPITTEPINERNILVFYPDGKVGFWHWSKGDVKLVWFYSHGINDRIAGTTTGTLKTSIQTHIANIKADYPGSKFIMCKNMTDNGNDVYNTVIQEIDDADADFVSISVSGAGVQGDGNHWTYGGMKQICDDLVTAMKNNNW